MKILSVRQPWASLIASGEKTIELRTWSTSYRGEILIISGKNPWSGKHSYELGPRGKSICVATLTECRAFIKQDLKKSCVPPDYLKTAGHLYSWVLRNCKKVPEIDIKGRLGLCEAPEEISRLLNL